MDEGFGKFEVIISMFFITVNNGPLKYLASYQYRHPFCPLNSPSSCQAYIPASAVYGGEDGINERGSGNAFSSLRVVS